MTINHDGDSKSAIESDQALLEQFKIHDDPQSLIANYLGCWASIEHGVQVIALVGVGDTPEDAEVLDLAGQRLKLRGEMLTIVGEKLIERAAKLDAQKEAAPQTSGV